MSLYLGNKKVSPIVVREKKIPKVKYGASIDNLLGNIDENGVYQAPTESFELDFTGLKELRDYGLYHMFYEKPVTKISFSDLETLGKMALQYTFKGSTLSGDVVFPKLKNAGNSALNQVFAETDVTSITFSAIETTSGGSGAFAGMCGDKVVSVSFLELWRITNGLGQLLYNNSKNNALKYINFPKLTTVDMRGLTGFARYSRVETFTFPELTSLSSNSLQQAFANCDELKSIYFPKLKTVSSNPFGGSSYYCFYGCTALTEIHFPADMQEKISAITGYADKWGATNATIYFDL